MSFYQCNCLTRHHCEWDFTENFFPVDKKNKKINFKDASSKTYRCQKHFSPTTTKKLLLTWLTQHVTEAHVLEINPSFGEQQVSCIHIILYLQQRGIWKLCMYNRTQETRRKAWHWADSELSKPDECIKTETMEKILRPLSSQIQESVCKLAPTAFANI